MKEIKEKERKAMEAKTVDMNHQQGKFFHLEIILLSKYYI